MRWRRPLAALAAVCVAATAMLALTTRSAQPATADSWYPMTASPSCAAPGGGSTSVHLTASNLIPGENTVLLQDQGPQHHDNVTVGTVIVGDNRALDTTVTLPAQLSSGLFRILVTRFDVHAVAYFSVPCPTISVQPTCGPADDGSGARYALTITGTGYAAPAPDPARPRPPPTTFGFETLPVYIGSEGVEFPGSPATPDANGNFTVLVTPGRARAGAHQIHAWVTTAGTDAPIVTTFRDAYATFTAPCPVTPTTPTTAPTTAPTTPTTAPTTAPTTPTTAPATAPTTAPTTKTTQTKTTQTVTTPTTPVTASISPTCLEPDANGNARVQVSGGGFSPGAAEVLLDGDIATKAAAGANGDITAEVELTPGTADHAITVRQGSRQADATLRVPCASHPKLKLDPAIGPPGFVTKATGSGFPPNVQVRLSWQPGIGTQTVRTNDKGAFEVSVLVFPQDQTGERALRATPVSKGRFTKVDASFLCVPGSVQRPQTFDFRR